jgi:hypothetical protein
MRWSTSKAIFPTTILPGASLLSVRTLWSDTGSPTFT